MVSSVVGNGVLSSVMTVFGLFCLHSAQCFDIRNWAVRGATLPACNRIRGEQLFDSVITNDLQGAKDFFTRLQQSTRWNIKRCRDIWDRYFPVPRPEYPDSPFLRTPLMEASRKGNTAMVQLLLNQGADANKQEGGRWTPLMWAAFKGHIRATRLLSIYANINAKDMLGETALKLAAGNGQIMTVKYLISHGADINARDVNGRTALMGACKNGWWGVVWALLQVGADINMVDREGKTALMLAITVARNMDIVKMLVEKGDYYTVHMRDLQQKSALDYASDAKLFRIARYLANKRANY